jgi:hypothetical protein
MNDHTKDIRPRRSRAALIGLAGFVLIVAAAAFLLGRATGDDGGESSSNAKQAQHGGFATLTTHRCPTKLGINQPVVQVAPRLELPLADASEDKLAAYASTTGSLLVGPKGWVCRAAMGVDGSEVIGLAPPGTDRPAWAAKDGDPAVTADIIPACAGCIASMICAFFPQEEVVEAYVGVQECPPVPRGEQISHVAQSTVVFVDPPEVEGTGTGSGGSLASMGGVVYGQEEGAMRVSCTLPATLADSCPAIVSAQLALR